MSNPSIPAVVNNIQQKQTGNHYHPQKYYPPTTSNQPDFPPPLPPIPVATVRPMQAPPLPPVRNEAADRTEFSSICDHKSPADELPVEVIISSCTRALVTHIRYCRDDCKLQDLMAEIQIMAPKAKCVKLEKGILCFAMCSNNGRWYRAKVLEMNTDKNILFENIDYGQQHLVPLKEDLFHVMDRRFAEIPPFASRVKLANVIIKRNEVVNKNIKNWISSKIREKKYLMEIVQETNNVKLVKLVSFDDGEDFAKKLHEKGLVELTR